MTKKGVRPGFSLMDWNRKRIDSKMIGTVSLDELRRHASVKDAWTVYEGQVYDITPYLDYHPGGVEVLSGTFGGDCTQAFKKTHRWVNGHALLGKCRVGAVERTFCVMSMSSRSAFLHASMGFKLKLVVSCVGCFKALFRSDAMLALTAR